MTIPSLRGKRLVTVDLDAISRIDAAQRGISRAVRNPYAQPDGTQELLDRYHSHRNVDASYGSYGEHRGHVWRGTYLDRMDDPVHLGIDVNVPAGTEIAIDCDAHVVCITTDHPEPYGWGNRVFLKLKDTQIWLIYAHLARPMCELTQRLKPGEIFATVGVPHENGGWFSHLHIQALTAEAWMMFSDDPDSIDGYCPQSEWKRWQKLCPNPLQFVKVP